MQRRDDRHQDLYTIGSMNNHPHRNLTRRQFLSVLLGGSTTLALPILMGCTNTTAIQVPGTPSAGQATAQPGQVPFPQPPVIRSANGLLDTTFSIEFKELDVANPAGGTTKFNLRTVGAPDPDNPSQMIYGYPGPTLRVKPGDQVKLLLDNKLNQSPQPTPTPDHNLPHPDMVNDTNLHYHGLHVTPEAPGDDVLHILVGPGQHYQYEFSLPTNQPPGTYWYHPHFHSATATQVANGVAGALIVEGDFDTVPEIAAAQDVVLVLQEIQADPFANFNLAPILVNGEASPVIRMRPEEVQRWRFIAATVQAGAIVELGIFPEGINPAGAEPLSALYQIAMDGIQFTNEQWHPDDAVETFILAPGNRADFLVQAPLEPGRYELLPRRVAPVQHSPHSSSATPTPFPTPRPNFFEEAALLVIEVVDDGSTDYPKQLPQALPPLAPEVAELLKPITGEEVDGRTRCLVFTFTGGLTVDGQAFNPAVVNQSMVLDTAEEWTIYNTTNIVHPFHIHVNSFVVTKVHDPTNADPNQVDTSPMLWQDTILLPPANKTITTCEDAGYVVIRHRFTDFTGQFVLHCHNLIHEDFGMMQVVQIVETEEECPPGTRWQDHQQCKSGLGLPSCNTGAATT